MQGSVAEEVDMVATQKMINELNDNSLYRTLGIRVDTADDGKARSWLTPPQDVCWPFPGQPHGGILFTFMDTTMAWSVLSQLKPGYNCTTVNLNIHFTHPAKGDKFTCSAWITHQTGRTCFVRADIHDNQERLLAMGQATFRIIQTALTP